VVVADVFPRSARRLELEARRGIYVEIDDVIMTEGPAHDQGTIARLEELDLAYRSLCSAMYNYVPQSGHPGGSISSGRIVQTLLFETLDYDFSDPDRRDADIISYAAGHKALGLYALWALRNEIARIGAPDLLPTRESRQLRLEDLLGFRRSPVTTTPLFRTLRAKPLDGHPTPATPFVRLATGASGVGLPASLGLAWAAADLYGGDAPRVHIIEGEGGMTPGRVAEALAAAGTASLGNVILHVDWNQASIDSNHVCREGATPGDYVQWTPMELAYLNDWNVIYVPEGFDFNQIAAAQRLALRLHNSQPTAIVYRTVKGWRYGIEGRASHGAGHPLCSAGFHAAVADLERGGPSTFPMCTGDVKRCGAGADATVLEECYWEALSIVRGYLERHQELVGGFAAALRESSRRLDERARKPRADAPDIQRAYAVASHLSAQIPPTIALTPGTRTTLREALGNVLNHYNRVTNGAVVVAAADLLGSTSVNRVSEGFASGFYNRRSNPESRTLSVGGICEDAITAMLAGIATFGSHTGAGSSYGAFMAPLGHIASRLHAIAGQARRAIDGTPYNPFFLVCAHAGLNTGEDGPTHADPQPLQLLQENFPLGTMITLTPWDPSELWHLVSAALVRRPAVIAPFVTRPPETILDREELGLAPAASSATGVYKLRSAKGSGDGVVVLQGSAVTYAFVQEAMPLLDAEGLDLNVYYVASVELFDALSAAEREAIFPSAHAQVAMGITDFTLPTMYRWIRSDPGRAHTMHPYMHGHYLGSGPGQMVAAEAGLDGRSQFEVIRKYVGESGCSTTTSYLESGAEGLCPAGD
jgi:transketolase